MAKLERSTETRYFEQGFALGLKSSHSNLYVLCHEGSTDVTEDQFIVGERSELIHLRDFLTLVIDGEADPVDG